MHREAGYEGVILATRPLEANDGFDGPLTLCLELPDDVFREYDVTDEIQERMGYRIAMVPADVLNRLGKPQIYDHDYAGCTSFSFTSLLYSSHSKSGI
jgi:hypothetical protein